MNIYIYIYTHTHTHTYSKVTTGQKSILTVSSGRLQMESADNTRYLNNQRLRKWWNLYEQRKSATRIINGSTTKYFRLIKFKTFFAPLAGPSLFVINPDQTFKFSMTNESYFTK